MHVVSTEFSAPVRPSRHEYGFLGKTTEKNTNWENTERRGRRGQDKRWDIP
jgi:hypothetical protein